MIIKSESTVFVVEDDQHTENNTVFVDKKLFETTLAVHGLGVQRLEGIKAIRVIYLALTGEAALVRDCSVAWEAAVAFNKKETGFGYFDGKPVLKATKKPSSGTWNDQEAWLVYNPPGENAKSQSGEYDSYKKVGSYSSLFSQSGGYYRYGSKDWWEENYDIEG